MSTWKTLGNKKPPYHKKSINKAIVEDCFDKQSQPNTTPRLSTSKDLSVP
ncbi:MAG: hypothetical protein J7L73_03430 [Anaerolineales bacterium]|nr:hypothetical protein [Anaerolineales bacterium]